MGHPLLLCRMKNQHFSLSYLCSAFLLLINGSRGYDTCTDQQFCSDDYEAEEKCPAYRGLVRHVPSPECPSINVFLKPKNCLSDADCCLGSYCCLSVCEGITRCYNPVINDFTPEKPIENCQCFRPNKNTASISPKESQEHAPEAKNGKTVAKAPEKGRALPKPEVIPKIDFMRQSGNTKKGKAVGPDFKFTGKFARPAKPEAIPKIDFAKRKGGRTVEKPFVFHGLPKNSMEVTTALPDGNKSKKKPKPKGGRGLGLKGGKITTKATTTTARPPPHQNEQGSEFQGNETHHVPDEMPVGKPNVHNFLMGDELYGPKNQPPHHPVPKHHTPAPHKRPSSRSLRLKSPQSRSLTPSESAPKHPTTHPPKSRTAKKPAGNKGRSALNAKQKGQKKKGRSIQVEKAKQETTTKKTTRRTTRTATTPQHPPAPKPPAPAKRSKTHVIKEVRDPSGVVSLTKAMTFKYKGPRSVGDEYHDDAYLDHDSPTQKPKGSRTMDGEYEDETYLDQDLPRLNPKESSSVSYQG